SPGPCASAPGSPALTPPANELVADRPTSLSADTRGYLAAEERAKSARLGVWQVPGGITRPWDFRRGRHSSSIPDGTTPGGRRYRCKDVGSYAKAQELLRQAHTYLDSNGDGEACESLR
uniref:excalibur calcium-binding domain-containing protein n=1 Tax=Synechococcus sp. 8F6 TaxID=2025606 RepID=UPI0018E9CBA1